MSKATSSTRSVMITRSLCPRSFWTCCANCTRMLPSSPKLEPLGREHSNCTSWAQRTVAPQLRSLWKFSFWTFCTANGKMEGNPSGSFVYLIGVLIADNGRTRHQVFWADRREDEAHLFQQFLHYLSHYSD